MDFFEEDGRYYPNYKSHTTQATRDMVLKAPTAGDDVSQISLQGHTPLSPFFSRQLRSQVVKEARDQGLSVIPGQCRLYSIHFPDEHASPPASTMNDGNVNEDVVSRLYEPREAIFTFVVEDRANLSKYPWDNFVTEALSLIDRNLLGNVTL